MNYQEKESKSRMFKKKNRKVECLTTTEHVWHKVDKIVVLTLDEQIKRINIWGKHTINEQDSVNRKSSSYL